MDKIDFATTLIDREVLIILHSHMSLASRELMEKKNKDYGGDNDVFFNFREDGLLGIAIRLGDKIARLKTASKQSLAVESETIEDTCLDVINYAVLFYAMHMEEKHASI